MVKLFHRDKRKLPPPLPTEERRKSGRKRALGDEDIERVRWLYRNTSCSMQRIADRYKVSQGVIQHVIGKKGAYKDV